MNPRQRKSVAVIGAGPGGLAAAMLLAAQGIEVDIFEKSDRIGGRTARLTLGDFAFDTGPTFFLYPKVLREIFEACGRRLDSEVELVRLDPLYRLEFENRDRMTMFADRRRLKQEIARFAPGDAENLDGFLADNRHKLAAFEPILQRPFESYADLLAPEVIRSLPLLRPTRSVDGDLRRYFGNELVRLAFSFQSKYLGMSPFKCPSLFTILSFLEHEHGIYHPIGGCAAVVEAMARVCRDMGVRIHLGQPVERIEFDGRRARAVATAEGRYECGALVVNADFAHALHRFVPPQLLRRWTPARMSRKRFSCSTFMLYLGMRGRLDELEHHNILLAEDYEGNIRAIEEGGAPPRHPSLYVQNAGVTDPGLAPRDHSTLYILVPVANQHHARVDWTRESAPYRRHVLERLSLLGLKNLDKRIVVEKIITPNDWEHDLAVRHGATFNLAHSIDQMLVRRPHNRFEDLDGVYLTGGGTHPGSGLPVIFEGARITARLLCEDFGLSPSGRKTPVTKRFPLEAISHAAQ